MQVWQPLPSQEPSTSLKNAPVQASATARRPGPSYRLRPSFIAFITALALIATCGTSVSLIYMWQTEWREIKRLPFISEAHYDDRQSPIFAVMTAVTAMFAFVTAICVFIVTCERNTRILYDLPTEARHATASADELDFKSDEVCQRSVEDSRRVHRLALLGLASGCGGATLTLMTGAISAKMVLHLPVVITSEIMTTIWTSLVNLTLSAPVHPPSFAQRFCATCMWVCTASLCSSLFAILAITDKSTSLIVLVEYVTVSVTAIFFFLLSFRLSGSALRVDPHALHM